MSSNYIRISKTRDMQYTDGESTRLLINWGEKAIAAKLEDSFTCEQAAEVFQSITDELRKG